MAPGRGERGHSLRATACHAGEGTSQMRARRSGRSWQAQGRWTLVASILATGIVFLDSTVVNVALPTIDRQLDAGLSGLQWIVDGYVLTLAALLILGGSLGDRYGQRRVVLLGLVGFGAGPRPLCASTRRGGATWIPSCEETQGASRPGVLTHGPVKRCVWHRRPRLLVAAGGLVPGNPPARP
jgi:MFS family permease